MPTYNLALILCLAYHTIGLLLLISSLIFETVQFKLIFIYYCTKTSNQACTKINSLKMILLRRFSTKVKLMEVGKLKPEKSIGKYAIGQLFIHKVFGYRGVILMPWLPRVVDRDLEKLQEMGQHYTEQDTGVFQNYYQVLVDSRDGPHIRAHMDSVTFFNFHASKPSLSIVTGLDYVSHEDISPYASTELTPLDHELFQNFLAYNPNQDPPYEGTEALKAWHLMHNPWLQLSDVFKQTTENIRVTVIPFYIGWRETTSSYWWRYCVRLENYGQQAVQLRERNWKIFSLAGAIETVKGRGVVGEEPELDAKHPAFQYTSHISLQSPSGHVWGTFRIERADGYNFECQIPAFSLLSDELEGL